MERPKLYVLDTNVLIHDPNAILNFDEHDVAIPMTVLEELDKLKDGQKTVAADCRHAIRNIDTLLGDADLSILRSGVPLIRADGNGRGRLLILDAKVDPSVSPDDQIIAAALTSNAYSGGVEREVILVTKDINMRLKAKGRGLKAEDYHSDKVIDDGAMLSDGYLELDHGFWYDVGEVHSTHERGGVVRHSFLVPEHLGNTHVGQFLIDSIGDVFKVRSVLRGPEGDVITVDQLPRQALMHREAWGLKPRDIYQALALHALLDPDTHIVNLTGAAGSGKTILALAAAIEQTMVSKLYRRIIVTRSTQGLDEDIGFLPGTEAEKMCPWLGAITDNLEALHCDDEDGDGSIDYILQRVPLQFKSLNFIRGRSFQHSILLIDECQNLTPHQMKTIITRAGQGSKVVCLGNLGQIDTPYLSAPSSGLTYLAERFKGFAHGAHINLRGVPRSVLAEFAEAHL